MRPHKMALLGLCDAVLACSATTGANRLYWQMLCDMTQPSIGSVFGARR